LPHVNLTAKLLRNRAEDEEDDPTDVVPFPKKWQLKKILLKVPVFNTTDVDQYGYELEQVTGFYFYFYSVSYQKAD